MIYIIQSHHNEKTLFPLANNCHFPFAIEEKQSTNNTSRRRRRRRRRRTQGTHLRHSSIGGGCSLLWVLLFAKSASKSSVCLSCHTKPKPVRVTVNEPPKRVVTNSTRSAVRKPASISEDFWTSSAFDMDNSAVQSQGSISSISTINQTLDPSSSSVSANQPEFVNHGLLLWNQTRQRWLSNKKAENRQQQNREPKLSCNTTCEGLLGSNKPFPQPIPLTEMVDFLVDIWEQEGMYD